MRSYKQNVRVPFFFDKIVLALEQGISCAERAFAFAFCMEGIPKRKA